MMSDITPLYDDFFEHHPRASLLLNHTGSLRFNAIARVLFGVDAASGMYALNKHDTQTTLQGLLHPNDYQHLHHLLTAKKPFSGRHTWRWLVARQPTDNNYSNNYSGIPKTHSTKFATHITFTEHGCCVVLEPTRSSFEGTLAAVDDIAQTSQDDQSDSEVLEDIINAAQTLSNVPSSHELPLEVALEHLPFAVFCVDKQWRFSFANTPAAQALGMTPADLLGHSLWEVAPELSQHAMGNHYREAMTHGQASYHEVVAHDPPFTGRWHATHLRPFAGGLLVTIQDVTQHKRSEESLLAQNAYSDRLLAERNAILASIDDYFFILDKSWTITYANDTTAAYFGTVSTELIGKHFWDVTNLPADHPILKSYQQAMASGQAQHVEAASSRHSNTYVDVHIYPYANGLVVYGKDVSERRQLEHHLQQALEDKEAILDSISDMMVCLDSDWRITYVNRRVQTFLSKDALGKHYFDIYPYNRGSIYEEKYRQVFDSQQPVTFEAQGSRSGYWLEHRVYPHQGGIVIYATDISERKRLTEQLEHTLAERDIILNSITDTIVVLDRNWTFRFANVTALNHPAQVKVGASYWEVFPGNKGTIFEEKYRQAFDSSTPVRFEARNNQGIWLDINVFPSYDRQTITIYGRNISKEKQLQQDLQTALQERDAIFESITDSVTVLDKTWRFRYANSNSPLWQLDGDVIGESYWNIFPDSQGNIFARHFQQVFDTGKPTSFEAISDIDGHWRSVRVFPNSDGQSITIYDNDITERKQLEQHLQRALQERDAIFESITDSVTVLGKDWRYLYANTRAVTHRHNTDIVGKFYWDIFPNSQGNIFERHFKQAFTTRQPTFFETKSDLDGRWREFRVYPRHDGDAITIYSSDIHERKMLEQDLQRALREREAIFDSITERVSVLDRDLRYVYVNKHARKLMPAEPIGKTIAELLGDNGYDMTFERHFRAVFATGKPVQFEHVSPTDDTWRDIRIYPSADGNTITVYSGDISERKKLEQNLQHALVQKDMLMKELHHRTKNNLQLVASMLALQARQLVDEVAKAALQNSQHRIRTLADIHSMLYRQDASTLDTASYLQLLADNIVTSTSRAPLRLEYQLDPLDLPLEYTIALGLITNELITNALKHAFPEPSDEDTIGLQLTSADNTVTFTLYNNGLPLAEDRRDSLGMTIIAALSEQLEGDFELANATQGVVARVRFKV